MVRSWSRLDPTNWVYSTVFYGFSLPSSLSIFRLLQLFDLVAEVEYVDPNGKLRMVSDPELLKAASSAFGVNCNRHRRSVRVHRSS
jgi:hypothetical protein